ncbi:MAG: RNase adapter RapZ [Rubrivivax sp.]
MTQWIPLDDGHPDEVILVTGISGSGKSVALHALEDAGYFCVDNLPPELLRDFVRLEVQRRSHRIAVAVDVRTASSLPLLPPLIEQLRADGLRVRPIFLDATTDALVRRFSESRRPHPLSSAPPGDGDGAVALFEAIDLERALLADLRQGSTVIDTSQLRPALLRSWVRSLVGARESALTLVFESFAFKYGVPLDADYVFDLRVLPNPHYVPELRLQNGRDAAVRSFLQNKPEVLEMLGQIRAFLQRWLPAFEDDHRSYLTVAMGCTGGQHRSVFAAEWLAAQFRSRSATLVRHRELDGRE